MQYIEKNYVPEEFTIKNFLWLCLLTLCCFYRMANTPPKYDDLGKESRDVFGKGYGKAVLKNSVCNMKLPVIDIMYPQNNNFAMGVENKATGDSKLNVFLVHFSQNFPSKHFVWSAMMCLFFTPGTVLGLGNVLVHIQGLRHIFIKSL